MINRMLINRGKLFKYDHLADTLLNKCQRSCAVQKLFDNIVCVIVLVGVLFLLILAFMSTQTFFSDRKINQIQKRLFTCFKNQKIKVLLPGFGKWTWTLSEDLQFQDALTREVNLEEAISTLLNFDFEGQIAIGEKKKGWLILSIFCNLSLLGIFKYLDFILCDF